MSYFELEKDLQNLTTNDFRKKLNETLNFWEENTRDIVGPFGSTTPKYVLYFTNLEQLNMIAIHFGLASNILISKPLQDSSLIFFEVFNRLDVDYIRI